MNQMPKYLMFDHGGVLDGAIVTKAAQEDIVLSNLTDIGMVNVLPNGVRIVKIINELVNKYDYKVVYHSSNTISDQLRIHEQLVRGSREKNLVFPTIVATASPNSELKAITPIAPNHAQLGTTGIHFYSYAPVATSIGKNCVRTALAHALGIGASREERQQHIVFDDGPSNVTEALREGYTAYLINKDLSLVTALERVLTQEKELSARTTQSSTPQREEKATLLSSTGPISALSLFSTPTEKKSLVTPSSASTLLYVKITGGGPSATVDVNINALTTLEELEMQIVKKHNAIYKKRTPLECSQLRLITGNRQLGGKDTIVLENLDPVTLREGFMHCILRIPQMAPSPPSSKCLVM